MSRDLVLYAELGRLRRKWNTSRSRGGGLTREQYERMNELTRWERMHLIPEQRS